MTEDSEETRFFSRKNKRQITAEEEKLFFQILDDYKTGKKLFRVIVFIGTTAGFFVAFLAGISQLTGWQIWHKGN